MAERAALHAYPSTFLFESRMEKEIESLLKAKILDKVYVAAVWAPSLPIRETKTVGGGLIEIRRIKLFTRGLRGELFATMVKRAEWTLKVVFEFESVRFSVAHCHSLSSMFLGVLLKKMKKCRLIYDAHELETERNGWPKIVRLISKKFEGLVLGKCDAVIVVNDSIRLWYQKNYYKIDNLCAVMNYPKKSNGASSGINLKKRLGIAAEETLFIYQGALERGRGIETALEIFSNIENKKRHIVFMGYGLLEKEIKNFATSCSNIHFHPAVAMNEILNYTRGADAGMFLCEKTCLSYYLSLPNKLFEYLAAGIPVISVDFPEVASLIKKYDCGWIVAAPLSGSLKHLAESITEKDIKDKKTKVEKIRQIFSWDIEAKKIISIYESLLAE